jgi:TolA-binding protein
LAAGCGHAPAETRVKDRASELESENRMLRDRISRLEQRVSDHDARISLLTDKVAFSGPSGGFAAPRASASPRYGQNRQPAPAPPPQLPAYARSMDLGQVPTTQVPVPQEWVGPGQTHPAPLPASPVPYIEPQIDAPAAPALPADVDGLYHYAHARLKAGDSQGALAAFEDVRGRFPQHHLADNALYWTAFTHAQKGNHRLAIESWKKLPMHYPESPKLADALFGMAESHEALGEPVLAETLYSQLVERHPKSEKAPKARRALKRLAGHF